MALRRLTLKTRRNFFHWHRDWNRRWPDRWPQPPDVQLLLSCPIQDLFEGEWRELVTSPGVELVLELHPVQPQGMQESREALHDQKDGYRQNSEHSKNDEDPNESSPASRAKANVHHHCPEHFRQLCMCQTEGPKPEVGGCVGNAAQAILDRVDGLMHKDVSKVELKERISDVTPSSTFYANMLQMIYGEDLGSAVKTFLVK